MPKRSKKNIVQNVPADIQSIPSSSTQCVKTNKTDKKTRALNPLSKLAEVSMLTPISPQVQLTSIKNEKVKMESKISSIIHTEEPKFYLLYNAMINDLESLDKGYECLQSFRDAELHAKSKCSLSCTKGYCIGGVKFVMRKQFNKIPAADTITPRRFAAVLTLAADKVFREKLVPDPAAMKFAFENIENGLGKVHGFLVKSIPETEEQKKLFYYYLITTIDMSALMEINPISCLAIAKWRLVDDNFKQIGLHNNALSIDETYVRCLSNITATRKYMMKTKNYYFHFKPDDMIDDEIVLKKIMSEVSFLKRYAAKPFSKRFCK